MAFVDVVAFHCPRCGRAVRLREGARVVRCPSCGGRSLVLTRPPDPRSFVEPELDRRGAAEAARAFLRRAPNRRGLERAATILAPRLYFLPFHNATGRRVAVFRSQVPELRRIQPALANRIAHARPPARSGEPTATVEIIERDDTRVQLADLNVWAPAFRSPRWDTTAFDPAAARLRAALHPLDLPRLQARGTVVSVGVPIEETEARALRDDGRTRAVGVRRQTVFFPFWSVPYTVDGARYDVLVAAAGEPGQIVCGHAPADPAAEHLTRLEAATAGLAIGAGARAAFLTIVGTVSSAQVGAGLFSSGAIATMDGMAASAAAGTAGGLAAMAVGILLAFDARRRMSRNRADRVTWTGIVPRREP